MNIESIYGDYLKYQDSLREKDEHVFHASTAGSCYRKQMYSYYNYPSDEKDSKSYRILRLGTLVHKDVEEALIRFEDQHVNLTDVKHSVYSEQKIKLKEFDVVGTYDAGEKIEDGDKVTFNLYDLKTAAAYKWTTKFGRKENRKPDSDKNYKLQLGTYALGVASDHNPDKINMYLVWYNKNTSQIREQLVSNEWMDNALTYWSDVYDMKEDIGNYFREELIPEIEFGVPMQDWECRYCQFYSICPSTLADKKPRF